MENLIIYPENQKQYSEVKTFLEEMKIRFKSQKDEYEMLADWQKKKIETGLKEIKENKVVLQNDVHKKASSICLK